MFDASSFKIHTPRTRIPQVVATAGAAFFLVACKPAPMTHTNAEASDMALAAYGAEVYEVQCAQCHYDGSGSAMMPSLRDSSMMKQPAANLIRIILHGQQGVSEVDGQKLGGIMPAQPSIDDEDIAAVVTYLRSTFGGIDEPVSAADVAALR